MPDCMSCHHHGELMSLRAKINAFESGEAFKRAQSEIMSLQLRLNGAIEKSEHYRGLKEESENKNNLCKKQLRDLEKKYASSLEAIQKAGKKLYEAETALEKTLKENEALKEENRRLHAQNETLKSLTHKPDGTNSGIPTRKTPIGTKKVIPATERSKGNSKGAPVGHEAHFAAVFDANDPSVEVVNHVPGVRVCPCCGKQMKQIDQIKKSEAEIEVRLIKKLHVYEVYGCENCGETVHEEIPSKFSGNMYYGENIQAIILELMEKCNVTMEASSDFIGFLVNHEIDPCAGYAAKLPVRAARQLRVFSEEVKIAVLSQSLFFWDDTVISIMTHQACFRFYGTETISLYKAHWTKAKDTIKQDGILALLDAFVFVMHDHCSASYNTDFIFMNLECIVHLIRTLNGLSEVSKHKWLAEILKITRKAIHDRKIAIASGKRSFSEEYLSQFWESYQKAIKLGYREASRDDKAYYHQDERALLVRLQNYAANYYAWLVCFDLPVSDNLSERNLRFVKSKLSIAGQFESIDAAEDYALIQTYIKTCEKNGIDLKEALVRVFQGNPFTLDEVLKGDDLTRYLQYREKLLAGEIIRNRNTLPVEETFFQNKPLIKENYQKLVYEFMSKPHTAEELVDILSARGEVKNLFKSEEVDDYKPDPDEPDEEADEPEKTKETIEEKPAEKKKPQTPIRRRVKKANGRPRKCQQAVVASGAPPG